MADAGALTTFATFCDRSRQERSPTRWLDRQGDAPHVQLSHSFNGRHECRRNVEGTATIVPIKHQMAMTTIRLKGNA